MEEQIFNAEEKPWVEGDQGRTKILVGENFSRTSRFRLFNLKPGEVFTTHDHDYTQCMYFTSGEGTVSIDDRQVEISPGLTVIVLPRQCHSISNHGNHEMNVVVFENHEQKTQDNPFVDF